MVVGGVQIKGSTWNCVCTKRRGETGRRDATNIEALLKRRGETGQERRHIKRKEAETITHAGNANKPGEAEERESEQQTKKGTWERQHSREMRNEREQGRNKEGRDAAHMPSGRQTQRGREAS